MLWCWACYKNRSMIKVGKLIGEISPKAFLGIDAGKQESAHNRPSAFQFMFVPQGPSLTTKWLDMIASTASGASLQQFSHRVGDDWAAPTTSLPKHKRRANPKPLPQCIPWSHNVCSDYSLRSSRRESLSCISHPKLRRIHSLQDQSRRKTPPSKSRVGA